jgi:hypothetical protein
MQNPIIRKKTVCGGLKCPSGASEIKTFLCVCKFAVAMAVVPGGPI